MKRKSSNQFKGNKREQKHKLFLNPYLDCAFTKCPKCETKTKVRKFPLVIHIEPQQIFLLNKKCKYSTYCDLIIIKKQEIESLIEAQEYLENPQLIGNNYLVMGTLERQDWKQGSKGLLSSKEIIERMYIKEIIERMYIFEDQWHFKVIPAGWYPKDSR